MSIKFLKKITPRWIRRIAFQVREGLEDRKVRRLLSTHSNLDAFIKHLESVNDHGVMQYHAYKPESRRKIFQSLYDALEIKFDGASILDLGPGYGDSLDLAREHGAGIVEFVDSNVNVVVFNTLKGFSGYRRNYTEGKGLTELTAKKYHVVLSKGSINADQFNREGYPISFGDWVKQVEALVAPGGYVIICPTFDMGTRVVNGSYYVCEDPDAFLQSDFTKILKQKGYETVFIEGFNYPKERFPFTFYKKSS